MTTITDMDTDTDRTGHEHEHDRGRFPGALRGLLAPHSHDAKDSLDQALEGSRDGIRAVAISLVILVRHCGYPSPRRGGQRLGRPLGRHAAQCG